MFSLFIFFIHFQGSSDPICPYVRTPMEARPLVSVRKAIRAVKGCVTYRGEPERHVWKSSGLTLPSHRHNFIRQRQYNAVVSCSRCNRIKKAQVSSYGGPSSGTYVEFNDVSPTKNREKTNRKQTHTNSKKLQAGRSISVAPKDTL